MNKIKKVAVTLDAGEDVEKLADSYTASGHVTWHSHSGEQHGGFLESETCAYHTVQQLQSQRNEHLCLHKNYIQISIASLLIIVKNKTKTTGNNPDLLQ